MKIKEKILLFVSNDVSYLAFTGTLLIVADSKNGQDADKICNYTYVGIRGDTGVMLYRA